MQDDSFIQAILAAPNDDAPRLIYADWLDEQGHGPRAEFIRLQCRLAETPEDDPQYDSLRDAEWTLLAEHGPEWASRLTSAGFGDREPGSLKYRFRRGLLEHVEVRGDAAAGRLAELFAAAPSLTSLAVRAEPALSGDPKSIVAELIKEPRAARLTALAVGGLKPPSLRELLESRLAQNLRSLDLSHGDLGGPGLQLLAHAEGLRKLERLVLDDVARNTPLVRPAVAALGDSEVLRNLRSLTISQNFLSDDTAVLLLRSRLTQRLEELNLAANEISDVVLASASLRASVPELRSLNLSARYRTGLTAAERLTAEGVHDALRWAPGLERLDLSGHRFEWAGAVVLAEEAPESLRELNLNGCEIGDRGAIALAESPRLARLRRLDLAEQMNFGRMQLHDSITQAGAEAIAASESLAGLRELNLQGAQLGDAGVAALAESRLLRHLRELNLTRTQMRSAGLQSLAKSSNFAGLRVLRMYSNGPFDVKALEALLVSTTLENLHSLGVGGNDFERRDSSRYLLKAFAERVHFL
ncbi:MAG TPA: TIGR02996 domain-containing protein [Pirellulales bacterium]